MSEINYTNVSNSRCFSCLSYATTLSGLDVCVPGYAVSTNSDVGEGPNVESALSMSPTTAMITAESHKPTIGTRKQAPTKKGVKFVKHLLILCRHILHSYRVFYTSAKHVLHTWSLFPRVCCFFVCELDNIKFVNRSW